MTSSRRSPCSFEFVLYSGSSFYYTFPQLLHYAKTSVLSRIFEDCSTTDLLVGLHSKKEDVSSGIYYFLQNMFFFLKLIKHNNIIIFYYYKIIFWPSHGFYFHVSDEPTFIFCSLEKRNWRDCLRNILL